MEYSRICALLRENSVIGAVEPRLLSTQPFAGRVDSQYASG